MKINRLSIFNRLSLSFCIFFQLFIYSFTTTYAQPPFISSFTPLSAKAGDSVTINGNGFNAIAANNVVFFGAVKATVVTASSTSIKVIVPFGSLYAPIQLLNITNGLSCFSPSNFSTINSSVTNISASNSFNSITNFESGGRLPFIPCLSDIDSDGKLDAIVPNASPFINLPGVSFQQNLTVNQNINFQQKSFHQMAANPNYVASADIDGDSLLDVVAMDFGGLSFHVLRNTSTPQNFSFSAIAVMLSYASSVAIQDIDKDGKPDLVVGMNNGNVISVYRNTSTVGNISFASKQDFTVGSSPTSVAVADIDGDGKVDIAIANASSNTISILRNISTANTINFNTQLTLITNTNPRFVAFGDIDGDEKLDIATVNYNANNLSIFKNTSSVGNISFDGKIDHATETNPRYISIGDLNGDGKQDLAVANYSSNNISLFQNSSNSGVISFNTKINISVGINPISIILGDIDNNGLIDLLVTNSGSNNFSIIANKNQVLPVSLNNFSATHSNKRIFLNWNSNSELNAKEYQVEKSNDGLHFNTLTNIVAKGSSSHYSFVDVLTATNSSTLYYRLKMIDKDGTFNYSSIKSIRISPELKEVSLYPNPVSNVLHVETSSAKKINIIDALGKRVATSEATSGITTIQVAHLTAGIYTVEIISLNGIKHTQQFIKK